MFDYAPSSGAGPLTATRNIRNNNSVGFVDITLSKNNMKKKQIWNSKNKQNKFFKGPQFNKDKRYFRFRIKKKILILVFLVHIEKERHKHKKQMFIKLRFDSQMS